MMLQKENNYIINRIIVILMVIGFFVAINVTVDIGKTGLADSVIVNAVIGITSLLGLTALYLINIIDNSQDKIGPFLFKAMVIMTYLGVFFDNLSWALDGNKDYLIVNYIMNICAFLIMPISLILFWNYQHYVFIGQSKTGELIKKIVYIFAAIDLIFLLIGSFTGYIFYIDDNLNYASGDGFKFVYIYPIIIVFCCLIENLSRKMSISKRMSLLSFVFLPFVTITLIYVFPEYSFVYTLYFIDLIIIYGIVENKRNIESLEKSAKISEQNRMLTEQQTQIMVSQIQPHFLYNTLTAIHQLCDMDTKLAQKMIQNFSAYLRGNMDGIRSQKPIPFKKELEHTKTYMEIELLRFGDILEVEYNIDVTDFDIPALSLQPLVENAVKYGVRSREDGGKVTISTKREAGKVYVSVQDDGMGFDINEKKNDGRSHVGIDNTRKRLELMMGAELCIESIVGTGTIATIILNDTEKDHEHSVS